ncbi:uncharacterized protein LOC111702026 [Eurytemora carolleeae]|uniref:uncharacterized protein LOC111702026 n=1 Tax=Eurytemora carolleeae TaxID=1294199 RepID=UPI000C78D913|nr:uncharacterized protein LOC111702026 [Eurytemora carolleeae]|eukprot:XP_023329317.1 uncharacterized protein LOC111702026 [Eurytemora affinis]
MKMAEKEAENSLNEDARNTQPTSNNSLHRDLELENQELKKKLDEALETCRSSRVYTREIELDKTKLEEILKVNRLGEDQFLISMEQQMRQRRTQNRRTNRGGFELTIKKMKFEGEYIEDVIEVEEDKGIDEELKNTEAHGIGKESKTPVVNQTDNDSNNKEQKEKNQREEQDLISKRKGEWAQKVEKYHKRRLVLADKAAKQRIRRANQKDFVKRLKACKE